MVTGHVYAIATIHKTYKAELSIKLNDVTAEVLKKDVQVAAAQMESVGIESGDTEVNLNEIPVTTRKRVLNNKVEKIEEEELPPHPEPEDDDTSETTKLESINPPEPEDEEDDEDIEEDETNELENTEEEILEDTNEEEAPLDNAISEFDKFIEDIGEEDTIPPVTSNSILQEASF
jgi:hypothetical protein